MMLLRAAASFSVALVIAGVAIAPSVHAQWWKRAPADFESCAELAEQAATKQEKAAALAECNTKFAGRRKPGGGYTYFDFLQDRTFDIAGPNPTPEEQKKIDTAYADYLAQQRRVLEAEVAATRQQQQDLQQVMFGGESERIPVPVQRPARLPAPTASEARPRAKLPSCEKGTFSCDWPRLSETLNELKRAFTPAPAVASKPNKG